MRDIVTVGLIGDYDAGVTAHQAIPPALHMAAQTLGASAEPVWVPTERAGDPHALERFDALWCVPASPYRSMDGALRAIGHARERGVPYLGTCGGFQHAIVEYARQVLGWHDAEHAETAPTAERWVIAPLACELVERAEPIHLRAGSRIAQAYGRHTIVEAYRCRYGLNPAFQAELLAGPLAATGMDENGEVRAVELDGHPFFVATLFQPERAALAGEPAPLVAAFMRAALAARRGRA